MRIVNLDDAIYEHTVKHGCKPSMMRLHPRDIEDVQVELMEVAEYAPAYSAEYYTSAPGQAPPTPIVEGLVMWFKGIPVCRGDVAVGDVRCEVNNG